MLADNPSAGNLLSNKLPVNKLHSRYNPQAEAERYINSLDIKDTTKCFILIEPGLGYIIPVLQKNFKDCKILVLHVEQQIETHKDIPTLNSLDPAKIQGFLETHIPRINTDSIRIIEWRPSLDYYKEAYVKLLSQVVEFLKRTDAGNRTTAAFGRKWIKNFFRNLRNVNKSLLYTQSDIPIIVTGSGPSLEHALPVIKNVQDSCLIIAASSSVLALSAFGISADLIIATDGGNWALKHIYPFYRNNNGLFAVNLCAALPSQCADTPKLIINDGSFWQSVIFHALSLPSIIIPQRGTVTATAVELAMLLGTGNIYLAGMDLAVNDIRTHVRPYSFDSLFYNKASRFSPFYSESFKRSSLLRSGGSMDIYASWFKTQEAKWPKRIFSIGESNIFKNSIPEQKLGTKNISGYFKTSVNNEDSDFYYKEGILSLMKALKDSEYSQDIKNELKTLLFSGKNNVTDIELENVLKELICQ